MDLNIPPPGGLKINKCIVIEMQAIVKMSLFLMDLLNLKVTFYLCLTY
jgi:hypothetical protein